MRNSIIIPIAVCLFPSAVMAAGNDEDTSLNEARVMQYQEYIYLHNVESGSINPVSISSLPMPSVAMVGVGYSWTEGGYHRADAAGNTNGLNVDTYGFKRIGKVSFEGGISYVNKDEKSRCWNSTLYINPLNPFVLADDMPSDYNSELFDVQGRLSVDIVPRFRFGLNAVYKAGALSDEVDPRVQSKGMRFILNPGVEFDITPSVSIGATGGINMMSEKDEYLSVSESFTYDFYLMSGLGSYYPVEGRSYYRDYDGTSWFAGGSIKADISGTVSDYLSVIYGYDIEKAVDGGNNYRFKGGEFNNDHVTVSNRLSVLTGRMAHNVDFSFKTDNVHGIWFDQVSEVQNSTTTWVVINESVKHKERYYDYSLGYRADWLGRSGTPSLTAGVKVGTVHSNAVNYPDLYRRKYSRVNVKADVKKYFDIKKVRVGLGVSFTGDYDTTSGDSYDFAGQDLEESYSLPLNAYLTSSCYNVSGQLDVKMPVAGNVLGVYVSGGSTQCTKGGMGLDGKSLNSLTCGITLAF